MPEFDDRKRNPDEKQHPLERIAISLSRGLRLAQFFPELSERLGEALKATGADLMYGDEAARHYLCAEALTEILEEFVRDGRISRGDDVAEIISKYSRRASEKVISYASRDARERAKIEEVYHEVNVELVRRGIEKKLLDDLDVSAALEEEADYKQMLARLQAADR